MQIMKHQLYICYRQISCMRSAVGQKMCTAVFSIYDYSSNTKEGVHYLLLHYHILDYNF